MESEAVHHLVHDEGRTCHVAGVLHERYAKIEDKDVRQEHDDTADTADDTVGYEILHRAVGKIFACHITQPTDQ